MGEGARVNFEIVRPLWLVLLGLLPLWWWWARPRAEAALLNAQGDATGLVALHTGFGAVVEAAPRGLRALALVCLIFALGQPQSVRTHEERVDEPAGIVVALDLSTSMLARDMAADATRLQVAKAAILRFLQNTAGDVGLVAFAGEALTRLPLTGDRSVVEAAVEALDTGLLRDGTDIAGATAVAGGLFRDTSRPAKVLILVTDGAHNKPGLEPELAARAAAAVGVKTYAIAVGGAEAKDPEIQAMETVLAQIARITGGKYFRARDVASLDMIYAEINRDMPPPAEKRVTRTSATPMTPWFLFAGLFFLLAGLAVRASRWGVVP